MRIALLLGLSLALAACGPIWRIPGGRLFGEEVVGPVDDWSFSDDIPLAAIETRPNFPHSVTVIFFAHEGTLYVPSAGPRAKKWPFFVLENPAVRLEIEGKIYRGRATRVSDPAAVPGLLDSLVAKYPRTAGMRDSESPPDVWLFRIDPV